MKAAFRTRLGQAFRQTLRSGAAFFHSLLPLPHVTFRRAPRRSLRLRLSVFLAALLLAGWCLAAFWSWRENREYIDAFFDTQLVLFAKRLASADLASMLTSRLPDTEKMLGMPLPSPGGPASPPRGGGGYEDEDAMGFAVFTPEGRLLLSDGANGGHFFLFPGAGFANERIRGTDVSWRIVRLPSLDGRHIVAVGQKLDYREEMAFQMLRGQMLPWLLLLPALLLGMVWMLGRELEPLRAVAARLEKRSPDDASPIEADLPSEARPLVEALNRLFGRMTTMLERERTFISDAAHELRTPLAGLSVQAQVAALTAGSPEKRDHALRQLRTGIDRANRLAEQLLLLFRLDQDEDDQNGSEEENIFGSEPAAASGSRNGSALGGKTVFWSALLGAALSGLAEEMEAKRILLREEWALSGNGGPGGQGETGTPENDRSGPSIAGRSELLKALLANLLGNAVKYTPKGGSMLVRLDDAGITIGNSGPSVSPSSLSRLGERFFRPPGQREPGSGLGLSISRRIARMHGLGLTLRTAPDWFEARLSFGREEEAKPVRANETVLASVRPAQGF